MDKTTLFETLHTELRQSIAEDPLAALSVITELKSALSAREREAVFLALEQHSWREIGQALGVSKQAAFQRFGKAWVQYIAGLKKPSELEKTIRSRLRE
jgi:DNA-directed RNA polymerase specialized sigma24 family protein